MKIKTVQIKSLYIAAAVCLLMLALSAILPAGASAQPAGYQETHEQQTKEVQERMKGGKDQKNFYGAPVKGKDKCGNGENAYWTKINFGCLGDDAPGKMGPIEDLTYAIVRFMSAGVGVIIVISIIMSGIQYSTSEGNPETTAAAKNRIQAAVVGLIIYIFAFSLIQYLVPGGLFR